MSRSFSKLCAEAEILLRSTEGPDQNAVLELLAETGQLLEASPRRPNQLLIKILQIKLLLLTDNGVELENALSSFSEDLPDEVATWLVESFLPNHPAQLRYVKKLVEHAYGIQPRLTQLIGSWLTENALIEAEQAVSPLKETFLELAGFGQLYAGNAFFYKADYDQAETVLLNACELMEKAGSQIGLADVCNSLGSLYGTIKNSSKGLEYLYIGYRIAAAEGFKELQVDFLNNLAVLHLQVGNTQIALDYIHRSLELAEERNDLPAMAYSYDTLGRIFYQMEDHESAENYLQKSLDYYSETNYEFGKIKCLINLGHVKYNLNQIGKAIELYKEAGELSVKKGYKVDQAQALLGISNLLSAAQKFSATQRVLLTVLEIYRDLKIYPRIGFTLIKLANLAIEKKDWETAHQYLDKAKEESRGMFTQEDELSYTVSLKEVFHKKGDFENAYLQLSHQFELNEKIRGEESRKAVLRKQLQFEYEKREALLKSEAELERIRNTELKAAYDELKTAQELLIHQEKMASLGRLTSGIAHELNNPLNFINNFSKLSKSLLEDLKDCPEEEKLDIISNLAQNLEAISRHGEKAHQIVTLMMQHSKTGSSRKEKTDLQKLLTETARRNLHTWQLQHEGFRPKLHLSVSTHPEVAIATTEIQRLLTALLDNAFYVVKDKEGGEVFLRSYNDGNYIITEVRDTGPGIPNELVSKIFEPFFTTKPTNEATGLGLSFAFQIARAHGGELKVSNHPEGGAVFSFYLPAAGLEGDLD